MGVEVPIFSLYRQKMKLSPYQEELSKTITFVNEAKKGSARKANLRVLLRYPWRYLSTLAHLLSVPYSNWSKRVQTTRHFFQGIYLTWLLLQDPPDHIHAHFLNKSATELLVASRILGIPYSVEVHASAELFVTPQLIQQKLSGAKFIATCTQYNKDYLGRLDRRLGIKARVIYHGLDANQFHRLHPPRTTQPMILGVGQLVERKGYGVLVDSCAILKERGVDFECRIVGEGSQRPLLEEKIRRAGLEGRVILTGSLPQEEVIRLYEQATVFTLPVVVAKDGDRDGIPNVLLEAMAMETPVVSTAHMAIPEVIKDGVNGLLVPPEDPLALAGALQRLIEDFALRERLAQVARRTVQEQFDPEQNTRKLLMAMQVR